MMLKLIKINFVRNCVKIPHNTYAAPGGEC